MSYLTARGGAVASLNLDHYLRSRELLPRSHQSTIFRQRWHAAQNLYQRNLSAHYGCVNALEFSHGGQYLASGGDDRRVLIWHVDQALANVGEPRVMYGEHASNIFCLGFDPHNSYVFSGGNDDLVIQHDLGTGKNLNYFSHDGPVYGLSVDKTSSNMFSVATEHGEILVYDLRVAKNDPLAIAKFRTPFNSVEFHPLYGNLLATANAKRGAMLWDIRHHAQALCQYNFIPESPSCMSVRFNCNGSLLLTLHRRLPPILYSPLSSEPLCTFYHHEYFNSCTMKSCTFAGPDDELVVSGSDNFNMFIWRLEGVDLEQKDQWIDTAPIILTGHRSIVNQVRYNRQRCLLASSGVEKIIKFWSPFAQQGWQGSLMHKSTTPYCTRTLHRNATDHVSQDFSTRNTDEDSVMLAFFDTLVQRELESWHTTTTIVSDPSSSESSATSTESDSSSPSARTEDTPNVSELSWQTHPNRIFYLIAKKRRALLHLALKCASSGLSLPRRVRGKSPVTTAKVEQLLASLLGENRLAATQARVSDWLAETQRLIGDDETPTTSAEAAARERWRRALGGSEEQKKPVAAEPKAHALKMIGSLQASFEHLERKRKLMRLRVRFAAMKRRRISHRPRPSDRDSDHNVISHDSDWVDDSDDDADEAGDVDDESVGGAQVSSSSTSTCSTEQPQSSHPCSSAALPETNNNSQMAANNNNNNNNKVNNGMSVTCNGDGATAEPDSATASQPNI